MNQFLFIAIAAGLIAFVGTPLTLIVAQRIGLVAIPNARRTHSVATPLMGGIAIWAAFVISLLIFGRGSAEILELLAIVVGGTVISAVGFIDDRIGLGPLPKLAGELLGALLLVLSGVKAQLFSDSLGILNVGLTVVWVIGVCNAVNYMDNMDGLAAGVSAVAAASFLMLAALNGQVLVSSLAAALLGACLGFLVYNFQPAVSFMGDAGSLLLGFLLAVLGIKLNFPHINPASTWMAPIVVLGLPLFDTALVTISRVRRGVSVLQGGADHTSHRLARLGLSHRRVVVALYSVGAALGLLSVFMTQSEPLLANLLLGALGIAGLAALWILEVVYGQPPARGFRPDLRVTVIAGGEGLLPILEGAMAVSRGARLLIATSQTSGEQLPPARLRASLPLLAKNPDAVRAVLSGSNAFADDAPLADQIVLAEGSLRLRGQLVLAADRSGDATEEALDALRHTDLIVLGGDLRENVLPVLHLAEIAAALRHSKRARVLVHPDPEAALAEIERLAGHGLITHIISAQEIAGHQPMWHTAADLRQGAQVAQALSQIWQRRTRQRGAPQPISGSMYG
jgi:UDP-GlcNAc:undecaprenyl-phosphate GlcNAc-1-phosphate transferase